MNRVRICAVLLVLAVVAGFLWHAASRSDRPWNVVIVTLDTTRADRLPAYGFMDLSMPALDRLAREGVVFDQALTVAPLTLPAHASLFTGLLPPKHGVRDNADQPLDGRYTTLAEMLLAQGFRTGAFVGSVVLGSERGLAQGFEHYSGVVAGTRQRRADEVVNDAIQWLDRAASSRFLLWTHLYDPHTPYDPPESYGAIRHGPYVGEIAFADSQIDRLLGALAARDLLDRTIVIVAGDHGEALGDHGEQEHGVLIYDAVLRVPLIVRVPRLSPRRVAGIVRLPDVMPTVLDLLGIPAPQLDGVSLVDLLTGKRSDLDLEAYAESEYPRRFGWSSLRALRHGRFKLIEAPRPELYDIERDPFEERNVYGERPSTVAAMTQRLQVLAASGAAETRRPLPAPVVPSDLPQQLAALGYIGSASPRVSADNSQLPDPKDCIGFIETLQGRKPSSTAPAATRCR